MTNKTILVVDDSKTILLMEQMILRQHHVRLLTASDGAEAIEKARAEHPDLILMDIMMPKIDGLEACRTLKSDETTREIPIIIVTTHGEAESVERAFECGCNDYVTKPINAPKLQAKVRALLEQ